jgi:hypothetical protein
MLLPELPPMLQAVQTQIRLLDRFRVAKDAEKAAMLFLFRHKSSDLIKPTRTKSAVYTIGAL